MLLEIHSCMVLFGDPSSPKKLANFTFMPDKLGIDACISEALRQNCRPQLIQRDDVTVRINPEIRDGFWLWSQWRYVIRSSHISLHLPSPSHIQLSINANAKMFH